MRLGNQTGVINGIFGEHLVEDRQESVILGKGGSRWWHYCCATNCKLCFGWGGVEEGEEVRFGV